MNGNSKPGTDILGIGILLLIVAGFFLSHAV